MIRLGKIPSVPCHITLSFFLLISLYTPADIILFPCMATTKYLLISPLTTPYNPFYNSRQDSLHFHFSFLLLLSNRESDCAVQLIIVSTIVPLNYPPNLHLNHYQPRSPLQNSLSINTKTLTKARKYLQTTYATRFSTTNVLSRTNSKPHQPIFKNATHKKRTHIYLSLPHPRPHIRLRLQLAVVITASTRGTRGTYFHDWGSLS